MNWRAAAAVKTRRRVAPAFCPALATALLAACGAKPPEPLPPVQQPSRPASPAGISRADRTIAVHAAPPAMEVPDVRPDMSEEPRWPLSIMDHPKLEPHHDVASVLANPGISWIELCARGVDKRRDPSHADELAYLGGWCAVQRHDVRASVAALAPLSHSVVPEIATAVPFDLANILVDTLDAEHAEQLLTDQGLRDAHLWDVLAASYFEVGKTSDSLIANSTALQLASGPADATCHRLVRGMLLGSDAMRELLQQQLTPLATGRAPDPTCADLDMRMSCYQNGGFSCNRYYQAQHIDMMRVSLYQLHEDWSGRHGWSAWIDIAWRAKHLSYVDPVATEMALDALDAAVAASNCEQEPLQNIWRAADAMATGPRTEAFRQRANLLSTTCKAVRDSWLASHPQ